MKWQDELIEALKYGMSDYSIIAVGYLNVQATFPKSYVDRLGC